jgi:excisionase family DNA binding protein
MGRLPLHLRTGAAAEFLGINQDTLRKMAVNGEIGAPVMIGKQRRWLVSELQAFLDRAVEQRGKMN